MQTDDEPAFDADPDAAADAPRFPLTLADRVDDLVDRLDSWRERPVVVAAAVAASVVVGLLWWLGRTPPPTAVDAAIPFASPAATEAALPTNSRPTNSGPAGSNATAAIDGGAASPEVVVHVAGAVEAPGVYDLPASARVHDAIEAAGGATSFADLDLLNLAAPIVDGMQIRVPEPGEEVAPLVVPGSADDGPVDLNRADAAELDTLPGVGPATAAAIVAHRDEHGPFASVDDLLSVPGIGPAKLAALSDLVAV
ncbi:MAG: helix-hairpin-helix domain-containing protein [Acidimicrobiales bacterium]